MSRKFPPKKALKSPEGVIELMASSTSRSRWNENCDAVQKANDGQMPVFWFREVMASGLAAKIASRF